MQIKKELAKIGLKQKALAQYLMVNEAIISRWEDAPKSYRPRLIRFLAERIELLKSLINKLMEE